MKITYNPYKPLLAYFNKFHGETYQKSLYEGLKINYLNDTIFLLKNNKKINIKQLKKIYVRNRSFFE